MQRFLLFCLILVSFPLAFAEPLKCPTDTKPFGSPPPGGTEHGCQKEDKAGGLIRHGAWKEWYINGQIHKEGDYRNGRRSGKWQWWYPNGQKMQEGYFVEDRPVGRWKQWEQNGKKVLPNDSEDLMGTQQQNFFDKMQKSFDK